MSIVILGGGRDDPAATPVPRTDFTSRSFGIVPVKRFPPYVFGRRANSCLMHTVGHVEADWYRIGDRGETLIKLKRPWLRAFTLCGYCFVLEGTHSRTCSVPDPDAIVCGRCNGTSATFGKDGIAKVLNVTRQQAGIRLGCAVKGY